MGSQNLDHLTIEEGAFEVENHNSKEVGLLYADMGVHLAEKCAISIN